MPRKDFATSNEAHPFFSECRLAITAAKAAGEHMQHMQQKPNLSKRTITHKGAVDFVSSVDLACEEIICTLLEQTPFDVLAEERGGAPHGTSRWIVDPLDGTTNYLHGFPAYAASIALEVNGQLQIGVIYNPVLDELFVALHGGGAWCNGVPITCSNSVQISDSLLATGFPYDRHRHAKSYLELVERFMIRCRGIRRAGSAALDLAHVACGRLDGFWERKLHSWDVAAGALLVEESGGVITDISGLPIDLNEPEPLASAPGIHLEMLRICQASDESKA